MKFFRHREVELEQWIGSQVVREPLGTSGHNKEGAGGAVPEQSSQERWPRKNVTARHLGKEGTAVPVRLFFSKVLTSLMVSEN
jgi:hypothetical protein